MLKEYTIKDIQGNTVTLIDKNHNTNVCYFIFSGLKIMINDVIFMNDYLLKEASNNLLTFGSLSSEYGRNIDILSEKKKLNEIIILSRNNNKIYLKRLYG